ncbi:LuxR family transcriptional regulator [Rhodococcus sp. ABRD24]|uniref:ATP-binding protein n=1 Tax=Rhodococcus sp. ABRD24 TaxID=2507582 RepID=UPI0010389937|nr:LuxR C-terminal-related transcriptional regulator [Rhodococcus sp. ABRD24]QBJ96989.1 LuxR family transcriptional regulator [Rhodococcus sp. ABRD24]
MVSAVRGKVGNLPLDLTSFVGRRNEVTEARRLLSASRLVTLTGTGGVGKTRLALRVAADSQRAFDDGVWFVEFGEQRDPQLVADTVAATLRLREQSTNPPLQVLTDYLAARKVLLVLDNCEHLIDAAAKLAETLLRTCPELRILATSREPLVISGETILRVPPLTLPEPDDEPTSLSGLAQYEAVTLFTERAAAAVPGFELAEDNKDTVAQICRQLDGLPLPIELAAARLRAMTADQILERLTDRYRLLTVGSRAAPNRQQTLRMSIDWSHELCTETEQELWRRLAVFAQGFELDAAEGIAAGDLTPDALLDVIASLVDKSILIREESAGIVRYRLLETLRDYGLERLETAGEFGRLRRRHRDWHEQLALHAETEWIGPRQHEWIARLCRERANLRAALEFCVEQPDEAEHGLRIANALYLVWLSRGLLSEGRLWLERTLDAQGGEPTLERVRALCAATLMAGSQGDIDAGATLVAQARTTANLLADPEADTAVTHAEGYLAIFRGDLPHAVHCLSSILDTARAGTDLLRLISTLLGLAMASTLLGETARTLDYAEEALTITQVRHESVYRAYALTILGLALWRTEPERARDLFGQGLRLSADVDNTLGSATCVEALAWLAAETADHQRSAMLIGAAESLWLTVGHQGVVVLTTLREHHDECENLTRRALSDRAYESAVRQGAGLSLREIVTYAVDEQLPQARPATARAATDLTPREQEVADLVAQGLTNKAIAEQLVISQRTAQGHVEHVLAKLGFNSRTQIAAWVVEQGQQGTDDVM